MTSLASMDEMGGRELLTCAVQERKRRLPHYSTLQREPPRTPNPAISGPSVLLIGQKQFIHYVHVRTDKNHALALRTKHR